MENRFPPDRFPIHCFFLFAKKNAHIADELKAVSNIVDKDKFRYSKTVNKYAGITVNVYCKDVDTVRPFVWAMKEKEMFIDSCLGQKRVYPRDLLDMARNLNQEAGRSR